MQVSIAGHEFRYPSTPDDLRLGEWIDFMRMYGSELDLQEEQLADLTGYKRMIGVMQLFTERAYAVASYFAGLDLDEAKALFPVPQVTRLYRGFAACFAAPSEGCRLILWQGNEYRLEAPELNQASAMTFGEVIDSKVMLHNAEELGWSRWELIRMLCSIFMRREGVAYDDSFAYLEGGRAAMMDDLPMGAALIVSAWYEQLNVFLEQAFTIFQESSLKSGRNMRKHFAHWGWVNFLKSVAKTKVFDMPGSGMNSIQCARASKAFDVLMYASEEKEFSEAMIADQDAKNQ